MHTQRARPVTRFLAILAIIITAVVSGGRNVQAFNNPFMLGTLDTLDCSSGSPVLRLGIVNASGMSVSQYSTQWTSPTLYVAYKQADGTLTTAQQPIPNIPANGEHEVDVSVNRPDTTFTIAIHASDPSGSVVKLIGGTVITPLDNCPKIVQVTHPQSAVVQQATNTIDQAMLAAYMKNTPTNVIFPKTQACFKVAPTGPAISCVDNSGFGLLIAWAYDPKAAVDGFRIYRTDLGQRKYMTSVSRNLNEFAAIVPAPKTGDFAGQCFAVVAVRNSVETDLSPSKCATVHDSLHEKVLNAVAMMPFEVSGGKSGGIGGWSSGTTRTDTVALPFVNTQTFDSNGELHNFNFVPSVGYAYDTNPHFFGSDENEDMVIRLGVYFNLDFYANSIQRAKFSLVANRTLVNFNPQAGNCAKEFAPAKDLNWATNFPDQEPPSLDALDPGAFQPFTETVPQPGGVAVGVDLTSLAQGWANDPKTNHGLIVRNPEENIKAYLNGWSCLTVEKSASLDIQYF